MTHHTRLIICSILFVIAGLQGISAEHFETVDMHLTIELKTQGSGPEMVNDRVLFSYSSREPTRLVGIAFLHEDFRTIHPFYRNPQGVFVLPYVPPAGAEELVYRLIVDGIWMQDPYNPRTASLPGGIPCSIFGLPSAPREELPVTTTAENGRVVFRYPADSANSITVAGDFNHWDPYMYSLRRDPSGEDVYSLSLPLPRGTYHYYFVVDGRRVIDPANPLTIRKNDGSMVSVLNVGS